MTLIHFPLLLASSAVVLALSATAATPIALKPLPAVQFKEDSAFTLDLAEYFSDPAGKPLVFDAEPANDSLRAWIQGTNLYLGGFTNWNGSANVALVVKPDSGQPIGRTISVRVLPVNDPPGLRECCLPDLNFPEDSLFVFDVGKYFADPDGKIARIETTAGRLSVTQDGQSLNLRGPKDWYGRDSLTIRMTDDSGATALFQLIVNVAPVNDPPVLAAMPAPSAIQANGSALVDFAKLASDVDDSSASLRIVPDSVPGTILKPDGLRLLVLPAFRNDTVTVTGKVVDAAGAGTPFAFKVFCNAGFRPEGLNLWSNVDFGKPARPEPEVLINPDSSFDALSVTTAGLVLHRYKADGTLKTAPKLLVPNFTDTISGVKAMRDGNLSFAMLSYYSFPGSRFALKAYDSGFTVTASRQFGPGVDIGLRGWTLDPGRKRVLVAVTSTQETLQQSRLEAYDYALEPKASKRFHVVSLEENDTASGLSPGLPGFYTYLTDANVVAYPDRYAVFWVSDIRSSRFIRGIKYATFSPELDQTDSGKTVDAFVDDDPGLPLDLVSDLKAYSHQGRTYLLWKNAEAKWATPGTFTMEVGFPSLRVARLGDDMKPASPLRKLEDGNRIGYQDDGLEFLNDRIQLGWTAMDSYTSAAKGFFLTRFGPDLDTMATDRIAFDSLAYSPKRHLLNGEVYLISRADSHGRLLASLADGRIPVDVSRTARMASEWGLPAPRFLRYAELRNARFAQGTLFLYDYRGRRLGEYGFGPEGGMAPPIRAGVGFGWFRPARPEPGNR